MNKKTDPRIVKSKRNIKNCFLELLNEKSLKDITVKEICEKALCSRNTFYCHYQYKEDLYNELLEELIESIEKATITVADSIFNITESTIHSYVNNIIHEIGKSNKILNVLLQSDDGDMFRLKVENSIYHNFVSGGEKLSGKSADNQYCLYCRYIAAGIAGFLTHWILSSDYTEEEAKQILYNIHSTPIKVCAKYLKYNF